VAADRLYNLAGMALLLPLVLTLPAIRLFGLKQGDLFAVVGIAVWNRWPQLWKHIARIWQEMRRWFLSPACILPALALSWLSIGLAFASFWVIARQMGISVSYWQASADALLAYFAALIPLAINGLGIQESSLTALLMLQGASLEQAAAAAFIIRVVTLAVSLLGGVRLLWGWQGLLKQEKDSSSIEA
ncbi:MAG: lysylphosphatidylglycerol synthase domain-containing protein, partial [Candidatus Villigracilaceae bacterium]